MAGVRLSARDIRLNPVVSSLPDSSLSLAIVVCGDAGGTREAVSRLRPCAQRGLLEARSAAEMALAEQLEVDGIVAKGHEAGGLVRPEDTFPLLPPVFQWHPRAGWGPGSVR